MDDNLIELYLITGAELKNKYDYTIVNGNLYYYWDESNDRKLNKPGFNWNGCFEIPEPIYFISTGRATGKTEKIEFQSLNKLNTEKKIIEWQQLEPTGYLIPRFRFIDEQFYKYEYKLDEYRQALKIFDIDENGTIPPEKIPLVSNYRDTLLKQLNRQANNLNDFNRQIANVLKVYYYESEQAIIKSISDKNTDEEKKRIEKDWKEVSRDIEYLFGLILSGEKTELIESHSMLEKLKENKYISEHLINTTIHGVITLSQKKDPLIDIAVKLAHKINPLESILEDALLNDKVRASKDYLKDNLTKNEIIQKAHDLKQDGMRDGPLFNYMKKWLFECLGFTNPELKNRFNFELHEHEDADKTFSRFVNNYRTNTNKNK